tara:strand:- start:1699 stop:3105 length:1407 start_codon:yes stop_codon:yes gene_type:complete
MASAPNSINYSNQLPLGIEAKSQRRLFFPSTGDSYSGDGSSIIRISLNYDGMLDTSLSYLKFDFKNSDSTADQGVVRDLGQPEISRLVVSSGGVVLEDIQNYNQLIGSILVPAQANQGVVNAEVSNRNAIAGFVTGVNASADAKAKEVVVPKGGASPGQLLYETFSTTNSLDDGQVISNNISVTSGGSFSVCYKLVSGLLDNDKYLPLVLMNNGIDIEIHLESGVRVCSSSADRSATYEISNVRYVAHLVDLQRDFYDMLRMTQQQSGGVIQIAGQTYRHFSNTIAATSKGEVNFNVPVRARSIKSIFFCGATQTGGNKTFDLSTTSNMSLDSYQVQIGATKYPPTAIKCDLKTNKGEAYFELMKSFGKLGSNIHDNLLCGSNYGRLSKISDVTQGNPLSFSPYGIDLETFRAELENGIDTSSRALPMTLLLNFASGGSSADILTLHTYALIDSLFFVNMDGSVSVSA